MDNEPAPLKDIEYEIDEFIANGKAIALRNARSGGVKISKLRGTIFF